MGKFGFEWSKCQPEIAADEDQTNPSGVPVLRSDARQTVCFMGRRAPEGHVPPLAKGRRGANVNER
jgi:hypothetical protein